MQNKTARDFGYPFENDGVILGRRPEDYMAGEATQLTFEERLPSGNWLPYAPEGEKQFNQSADSLSCVTFAETSGVEIQEKFLTGRDVNYSDRFTAKRSGTTRQGNYLYKVADAIRKEGLVAESSYPTPETYTWDEYHAEIPESLLSKLLAEGQEWLKTHEVKYEWVEKSLWQQHLKHAPLTVIIPGHAIEAIILSIDDAVVTYFDSYEPYVKTAPLSAFDQYALKLVLTMKGPSMYQSVLVDNQKAGIIDVSGRFFSGGFASSPEEYQKLGQEYGVKTCEPDGQGGWKFHPFQRTISATGVSGDATWQNSADIIGGIEKAFPELAGKVQMVEQ